MEVSNEARALYLERRRRDLQDCQTALSEENFSVFQRIGHQLQGNAQPFGFAELAKIGLILESAAKEKNLNEIRVATVQFQKYVLGQCAERLSKEPSLH